MPDNTQFLIFLSAALLLAITPGPGIFYVLARTLKGGREEGIASSLGTAIGGVGHVVAAALGISTLLATSALAFEAVRYLGAAYLVYLGVRTLLARDVMDLPEDVQDPQTKAALYQGILTEVLNPKTALFFLAFIPQFINTASPVLPQFLLLGTISVFLNTAADIVVVLLAGPIGQRMKDSLRLRRGQRLFSGCCLIGLGGYVAVSGGKR